MFIFFKITIIICILFKEVVFSPVSFSWLVCQQARIDQLTFSADPDKETDPGNASFLI